MKSQASISVALCTYNGGRYLRGQLESIAGQTVQPCELVACDDGSSDDTIGILREFSRTAAFPVEIVRNPRNLGSTKNFEQAMRLCRGELIALCDQDDWWTPEKLGVLSEILVRGKSGAVFSDGLLMDAQSKLAGKTFWDSIGFRRGVQAFRDASRRRERISELLKRNVVPGAATMIRSDCREIVLPLPAGWVHDGWLAWMMTLHSSIVACPRPLIHYRVHDDQQVGAPMGSVTQIALRSRAAGGGRFRREGGQFQTLLEYVEEHPEISDTNLRRRIAEKRDFMIFRAELRRSRFATWAAMIPRFSKYRSYALGLRSMAVDAFR